MSLAKEAKDVSSLAEDLELESDRVSHHCRILLAYGLVECEVMGTRHVYRLGPRWAVNANEGMLHLSLADPKGLDVELRFPEDKVIWWYPTPVTVGRFGLPGRRGG